MRLIHEENLSTPTQAGAISDGASSDPIATWGQQHRSSVQRFRCYADHEFARHIPRFDGIDLVHNPEEPFEVIIAENPAARTFGKLLACCSNPAAPMIAFSNALKPRADVVLREATSNALRTAITSLSPIVQRLAVLPPIPRGADRMGLLALSLAYSRACAIDPRWQPLRPELIEYPLLLGFDNARTLLEELADAGLLRRRFTERLHLCSRCNSSRVHVRELCITCKSSHLLELPLIHHYACAFQAPQSKFQTSRGYVCPKCGRTLRHYGVDYDKPGMVICCQACGDTIAEPDVGFVCIDCTAQTSGDHAQHRDWYSYDLLPDGIAALRTGSLPRAEIVRPTAGLCSLREFRQFVSRAHLVAEQHDRPITAWRANFNTDGLTRQVGPFGAVRVLEFVGELVAQNVAEGDLVVTSSTGILACFPESDRKRTEETIRRVFDQIDRNVKPRIKFSVELFERERIPKLLDGIC